MPGAQPGAPMWVSAGSPGNVTPSWDDGLMTNNRADQPGDLESLLETVDRHQGPDMALQMLVDIINRLGDILSIGITILVHGQVVTGEAVSGRAFFEGIAHRVKLPVSGDNEATAVMRDGLAKGFEALRDSYPTFLRDESDDNDEERGSLKTITYLHLKNAYVFLAAEGAATIPTDDGLWLRVRLSTVGGFAMGTMTVT